MEPLKNILLAGLGVLGAGKDKLQATVESMVDKGELTREQAEKVLESWVERGKEEQAQVSSKVSDEIQRVIQKLNLVTRDELDAVIARVEALEGGRGDDAGPSSGGA